MSGPSASAGAPAGAQGRRPHGRWTRALLIATLGTLAALVLALALLRIPAVGAGAVNALLRRLSPAGVTLAVREARIDALAGVGVVGLRMSRGDTLLASADTLSARWRLLPFRIGRLEVAAVDVAGLELTEDLARPRGPKRPGPGLSLGDVLRGRFYHGPRLRVRRLSVRRVDWAWRPAPRASAADAARPPGPASAPPDTTKASVFRLAADAEARDLALGGGFALTLDSLGVRWLPSEERRRSATLRLSGALADGRLELRDLALTSQVSDVSGRASLAADARLSGEEAAISLDARRFDLADLDLFVPGLGLEGTLTARADLRGSRLDRVSGTIEASLGRSRLRGLDIGPARLEAAIDSGLAEPKVDAAFLGAHGRLTGWIRPFDTVPTYDLDLGLEGLPRVRDDEASRRMAERADLSADVRVRGRGWPESVVDVSGGARAAGGTLALEGHLDRSRGVTWDLRKLTFERVDLARLAGDTAGSALSGALVAHGRGARAESLSASAELRLDESSYGARRIASAGARARLRGTSLHLDLTAETDAGSLIARGIRARLSGASAFSIENARIEHLDLSRLGGPGLESDLNATLDVEGSGLTSIAGVGGPSKALRDGRLRGDVVLVLMPSRLRAHAIERGEARASLAGGAVSATASVASGPERIELTARGRPFDGPQFPLDVEAAFRDLDLRAWMGPPVPPTRVTGRLEAKGSAPGSTDRFGSWTARLDLDRPRVGGFALDRVAANGELSRGQLQATATLRVQGEPFALEAHADVGGARPRGEAHGTVPFGTLAAFSARDTVSSEGEVRLDATFDGVAPSTAIASIQVTGRGRIEKARVDTVLATLSLEGGVLTIDTLSVRSNVGQATGAGRVALADSARGGEVALEASVLDPTPLAPLLGADTLGLGTGTITARLSSAPEGYRLEARGSLRSLAFNDLRLLTADAEASGTLDRSWRPRTMQLRGSANRLRGQVVRVASAGVTATIRNTTTDLETDVVFDDRHRARIVGQVIEDSTSRRLTFSTLDVVGDSAHWALERPATIRLAPDRLEVTDLSVRSEGGHVTARGVIDRRGSQDFRLRMEGIGLDLISLWLGRPDLEGVLGGSLTLSGPAEAPRGESSLRVSLSAAGKPAATIGTNATWNGQRLDVHGRLDTPQGDSLAFSGALPLAFSLAATDSGHRLRLFEGDVEVLVRGPDFPLRAFGPLLNPRNARNLDGTLDVDVRLEGTTHRLAGHGSVEVVDGAVELPPLGVTYRAIGARGDFQGDRLVLGACRAQSGKGSLQVEGQVRFRGINEVEPDLRVRAQRFQFTGTPDLRAVVTSDVHVGGRLTAPVAKGRATIEDSYLYLGQVASEDAATAAVPLTPDDIRMLEQTFGYYSSPGPQVAARIFDASDLDLTIRLERNTWVRQRTAPRLAMELTGEVHLTKAPHGKPNLVGRIEPVPGHGYVEQFARSFDFTGGEVLLNGGMKDHTVNIKTEYKPGSDSESGEPEVVVRLDVEGRIDKLQLTLSSEPSLSETEILSYIATGRNPTDWQAQSAGSGSDAATLAKEIGMSQVTGALGDVAQQSVGLDVLQVRYDALQGATLVAGRYIDPQLYIGFRQPLQDQSSTSGTNDASSPVPTRFEVEYAAYRWLVLNVQGETSRLRSFIRARHAY